MTRPTPYQGWTIFSRSSRTEWPIAHLTRSCRKDAIDAFKDDFRDRKTGEDVYAKRIFDGSIRVGKVIVQAMK